MENKKGDPNMELKEIVRRNFETWADSLKTKDPKKVAELYSKDSTFLPTVSGEFKRGQDGAEEYFKHFLEKNPTGEIIQEEAKFLGDDCVLHSGLYNFEVGPEDNRQTVEARFTYTWKKNKQGKWEIVHHHSSTKSEKTDFSPSLPDGLRLEQADAEEYFKSLLKEKHKGEIIQEEKQALGEGCFLHSGIYSFEANQDGVKQMKEARFTFVWRKEADGKWKIIHHHSSVRPKNN